jgi:hypothetical protein
MPRAARPRHDPCPDPIGRTTFPLKGLKEVAEMPIGPWIRSNRRHAVQRYRRLMVSLGWLAAFLMAVGAGWKNS